MFIKWQINEEIMYKKLANKLALPIYLHHGLYTLVTMHGYSPIITDINHGPMSIWKVAKKTYQASKMSSQSMPEVETLVAQFMAACRLDESSRLGESIWWHGLSPIIHHHKDNN